MENKLKDKLDQLTLNVRLNIPAVAKFNIPSVSLTFFEIIMDLRQTAAS